MYIERTQIFLGGDGSRTLPAPPIQMIDSNLEYRSLVFIPRGEYVDVVIISLVVKSGLSLIMHFYTVGMYLLH